MIEPFRADPGYKTAHAMPERVEQPTVDEIQAGTTYICADPVAHKVCNWMVALARETERARDESRLLAAETRVREVEAERAAAKEDASMAWDCVHMIASDCLVPHLGEEEVKKIAPMFYPEAIGNAMSAIVEKEKPGVIEKARRVEQAEAIAATLRAERDALLPVARFGMHCLDAGYHHPEAEAYGVLLPSPVNEWYLPTDTEATTQARGILARGVV